MRAYSSLLIAVLASLLLVATAGCTGRRGSPTPTPIQPDAGNRDGGRTDDGGVTRSDTGTVVPRNDAGTGRDIVVITPDSGGGMDAGRGTDVTVIRDTGTPPSCTLGSDGLTGRSCFPRCSSATSAAASGCEDQACVNAALARDTTPPVSVMFSDGVDDIDCSGCYNIQFNTCIAASCPTEFDAYATCSAGGGTCTTEVDNINACVTRNMTTVQTCAGSNTALCFP